MADEEQPLSSAGALARGDEVARAPGVGHRHPAHCKAERFKLSAHHPPDGFDTGEVHRAAILVHKLLEEGEGARLLAIDRLDHMLFGGAETRLGGCGKSKEGERRQQPGLH